MSLLKSRVNVIPRAVKPLFLFGVFLAIVISVALILGEEQERRVWEMSPSTLHYYATENVCKDGFGNVLNCGHCGSCSNVHDIRVYHEKRMTLTGIMTDCTKGALLFGSDPYECLKERAGLTDDCTKCWIRNHHCTLENCVRTCVKNRFFPFLPSLNSWNSEPLDPCIACDEKLCGPGFVQCAGANRRNTGVVSDIERFEIEICDKVDWDWILKGQSSANKPEPGPRGQVTDECVL